MILYLRRKFCQSLRASLQTIQKTNFGKTKMSLTINTSSDTQTCFEDTLTSGLNLMFVYLQYIPPLFMLFCSTQTV